MDSGEIPITELDIKKAAKLFAKDPKVIFENANANSRIAEFDKNAEAVKNAEVDFEK